MLTVDHSKSNKNQYVHLTGNLSGIDALSFRDNVHSIIYKDSDQLILDMTGVKEMDLTGFNAIVMLKKELTNAQRKLTLIVLDENPVHEFIHLSKLTFNCSRPSQI